MKEGQGTARRQFKQRKAGVLPMFLEKGLNLLVLSLSLPTRRSNCSVSPIFLGFFFSSSFSFFRVLMKERSKSSTTVYENTSTIFFGIENDWKLEFSILPSSVHPLFDYYSFFSINSPAAEGGPWPTPYPYLVACEGLGLHNLNTP